MRNLHLLDLYRVIDPEVLKLFSDGHPGDHTRGAFVIKSHIDGGALRVIADSGDGWDHVSVSREDRAPTYDEMERIATLFFKDDEVAMQFHVPRSKRLEQHRYCLNWWRWQQGNIPLPEELNGRAKSAGPAVAATEATPTV